MACTSRAPAAYDPVRKYAFAPSPSTRQSSTPSDSRNCVGLMRSVTKSLPVVIGVRVIKRRRLLRCNMVAWYDTEMTIDQILTALAEQPKEIGALTRICRELECTFPRAA